MYFFGVCQSKNDNSSLDNKGGCGNEKKMCIGVKRLCLILSAFCFKGKVSVEKGLSFTHKLCKILENTLYFETHLNTVSTLHIKTFTSKIISHKLR